VVIVEKEVKSRSDDSKERKVVLMAAGSIPGI
jgi:hypothetical protein